MGIKEIFKEGSLEFKRRSELGKAKRSQKEKVKLYEEQLATLGRKAWESQIDIAQYGETEKLIATTQKQLDELKTLQASLETQKKETEAKRTKENENFEAQHKEIAGKKKEVDSRLEEEKKVLKEAQKTSENAKNRLTQILKDEESLNKKLADVQTPEQEKNTIREKLAAFPAEQEALEQKKKETWDTITRTNEAIVPIEEESVKHQKEIDKIRADQKTTLAELDKSLSELKTQLNDATKKMTEINNEQSNNFKQLGGQITSGGAHNEEVKPELLTVQTSEKEIADLNAEIERLDTQGTGESRSALWKMIGVIVAALVIVVGIIILILFLIKPKDVISSKLAGMETSEAQNEIAQSVQENAVDAMKQFQDATGNLKKESEKIQGGKIVLADKATLIASLPTVSGWIMSDPSYSSGQMGQLSSAHLSGIYKNNDSQEVNVDITDAGNSSALLAATQYLFSMNISTEDENSYEKITTINNIPMIERYDKQSKRAQLTFIAKKRYIIALNTECEDSMNVLKQFIPRFNLSKLQ